jgi:hypothetical protein
MTLYPCNMRIGHRGIGKYSSAAPVMSVGHSSTPRSCLGAQALQNRFCAATAFMEYEPYNFHANSPTTKKKAPGFPGAVFELAICR